MKIRDLPLGCIIWYRNDILGITGATLPGKYYDMNCKKINGNDFDYELVEE
ncbi:MAG: hypothetical protein J6T15_04900 [Bacilli bacterium]|nr:hypothetical protein [Bacilli bacterium]